MINQTQLENVEYFSYWGSMITNGARCTREIQSRIAMEKVALNKNKTYAGLKLRKKLVKCHV